MLKYLALSLSLLALSGNLQQPAHAPRDRAAWLGHWIAVNPTTAFYLGPSFSAPRMVAIDIGSGDAMTMQYVAATFIAERSITLDRSATEHSLTVTPAPGMSGFGAPKWIVNAVSRATWLKDTLRIAMTVTTPFGAGLEENPLFKDQTSTTDIQDVVSLGPSGHLIVETRTSSGGGAMRTVFERATDEDARRVRAEAAARMAVPDVRGPERSWFGDYRFGMTPDDVRRVGTCPNRDYRTITGPFDGIGLLCRRFPLDDLELTAHFAFRHNGLTSMTLERRAGSEKEARHATEILLAYLAAEGGDLRSLELGTGPVTAAAIWDYLDQHQQKTPRDQPRVTVTTANASWPVVVSGSFSKNDYMTSLLVMHDS